MKSIHVKVQGEPKLSDYFVFVITLQPIDIDRSIKNNMIARFMEIYSALV